MPVNNGISQTFMASVMSFENKIPAVVRGTDRIVVKDSIII